MPAAPLRELNNRVGALLANDRLDVAERLLEKVAAMVAMRPSPESELERSPME